MLRPQGPAGAAALRRTDLLDALHDKTESAADQTTRRFLRHVLAQVRRTLTGNPAMTAAGEPVASDLFGLGQAQGWWADAVHDDLAPVLREVWEAGYSDTTTIASSTDAAAEFLARVKDRLSPTASPGLPGQAFDLARRALAEELATGASIPKVAERLAAEFSWDDPAAYWRRQKTAAQGEIDTILDVIGRPGEYAREQAKRTDPRVKALRAQSNEATKRIDDTESTWKARATRIARTETTGAFSAGAHQAYRDEGVTGHMWLATLDARTRDTHKTADRQVQPLGQPFRVGGVDLMFPGDPNGPAREVINCRCTTVAAQVDDPVAPPDLKAAVAEHARAARRRPRS